MMKIAKLLAVLSAVVVSATAAPASAASPVTNAFLANVGANLGFLTQSSRLVEAKSATPALRRFATSELAEQVQVATALVRLAPARSVASADDPVTTGRSVAVDGQIAPDADQPAPTLTAANGRVALGEADIAELQGRTGRALDDLYWQQQLDALSQLEADYRTYIAHGDDPVLVAMAKADLPRVMKRLEALSKI